MEISLMYMAVPGTQQMLHIMCRIDEGMGE